MKVIKLVFVIAFSVIGLLLVKQADTQANDLTKRFNPHEQLKPVQAAYLADEANMVKDAPALRTTRRISIPYGFRPALPILAAGSQVETTGHGGCTAGEQVTVAITITQPASGAVATGENEHTCTGQLQIWRSVLTADTPTPFEEEAAEACGLATSRDGADITDTYAWCRDVVLVVFDHHLYLPLSVQGEAEPIWSPVTR